MKYRPHQEKAKEMGLSEEDISIPKFIHEKVDFTPVKPKETRLCFLRLFKSDYTGIKKPLVRYIGGCSYEGEWDKTEKLRNGLGTFYGDTQIYDAYWKNDRMCGRVVRKILRSGEVYEGECDHWMRHGKGKMITSAGICYNGDWKDNKMHGHGIITFPTG